MTIVIDKLSISFEGKQVLKDFSISLPASGVVCIFGPSGCGKTVLFKCLSGLIKPDSGEISGLKNKRVSMVFQENRLLPWCNAVDNVALVVNENRELALAALTKMELTLESNKLPAEMSGGMQRRVAIARAIVYDGDLLLLDEPTTGLDAELADRIMKILINSWQNRLVLLITHELTIAKKYADIIYTVEGPPLQIKNVSE